MKLIILSLLITGSVFAQNVPHNFISGSKIEAQKINENFSKVSNIIHVTAHKNCTRTSITLSNPIILETIPVDKKIANSTLIIEGTVAGHSDGAAYLQQEWKYGSAPVEYGGSLTITSNSYDRQIPVGTIITGNTSVGLQNLVFQYRDGDGNVNSPFAVYNPNSSDHTNLIQTCSFYTITEIAN